MALNPFFLHGTSSEQRLVQDLINEQLRMYGVEVIYIPRKYVNKKTIIEEVTASRFDDNFAIEAYVNNFEGYSGQGDILTKFGVSLKDELAITISKERFEDFISPFLSGLDDGTDTADIILSSRPREGDLVYFPLGERLFEVKFVEHESPFYQLGKNYVYELKCELFEYEDEVIDTSIREIDTRVKDDGYITTLKLIGIGRTATATSVITGFAATTGYIKQIFINNDGSGYTSVPTVAISTSPTGNAGDNAVAVGFLTTISRITSLERILLTNAGAGYTVAPTITISGGGGTGAAATCSIETTSSGVLRFVITDGGIGYGTAPMVTVNHSSVGAAATAGIGVGGTVNVLTITNAGTGYTGAPTVTVSSPGVEVETTAVITATISAGGVTALTITNAGTGYTVAPTLTIGNEDSIKSFPSGRATGISSIGFVGSNSVVKSIYVSNPGFGYTTAPTVTIANPESLTGIGTYLFNEVVVGSRSKIRARVKDWDKDNNILKISNVGIGATQLGFFPGETITGTESGALYTVETFDQMDTYNKYSQNDEIEEEADLILDFTESNPFGGY
jgi:hypothetical protein